MIYEIDYRNIISNLTPSFLRANKFLNYLYSIVKGIKDINTVFYNLTQETKYILKFTSQVIYIEKYLNDKYDSVGQRIYILNSEGSKVYLFQRAESAAKIYLFNRAENLEKTYLGNRGETLGGADYIVYIPTELLPKADEIRASVNMFNPADKAFTINEIP